MTPTSNAIRFPSPFIKRLRPGAEVPPRAIAIRRSALRLIDHVRVLIHTAPPAVDILEQWACRFRGPDPSMLYRPYPTTEDARLMTPRHDADDDARDSARRLIEFIHTLTPSRPVVVHALEQCMRTMVIDEARQRIIDRVLRFGLEDVASVDVLTAQLEKNRRAASTD